MANVDVNAILYGDDAPREEVNLIKLYEDFCKEDGCRVNSALLRYMEDRGGTCSLERLLLNGNYLGPRGLRPVVRLIPYCQTLTTIDLENNGADNSTVELLCEVLARHMSVAWVSLRGNPITVPGGKRLLALLEENPRITHLDVAKTDIFDALQDRIRLAVLANGHNSEHAGPLLHAGTTGTLTDAEFDARVRAGYNRAAGGGTLPSLRNGGGTAPLSARLEPITQKRTAATVGARAADRSDAAGPAAGMAGAVARTTAATATATTATTTAATAATAPTASVTPPQPRPPIPALASRHSSRLPPGQLKSMRAVFAARAKLADETSRSEVSRAANSARTELQALETYHTRTTPDLGDLHDSAGSSGSLRASRAAQAAAEADLVSSFDALPDVRVDRTLPVPTRGGGGSGGRIQVMATAPALGSAGLATGTDDDDDSRGLPPSAALPAPTSSIFSPRAPPSQAASPTAPARTRRGVDVKEPTADEVGSPVSSKTVAVVPSTVEEMLDPAFMLNKTSEEQFQLLFDQGCREYAHRNLDTAYMAWNEAMSIAVRKKNREWMAVVSSNLQRLSYELLVNEGVAHLEGGELEEADGAFGMAEELAVKVRNATWEAEMQTARKRVLRAVFQRSHEAALVLFERTRQLEAPTLTEDDYFVIPGTDLMVPHTAPFVEEWSRMLLVQEALGMWADAARVAKRVGGTQATVLQHVIDEALESVAGYLARRFFDTVEPDALSWQGTSRYHYFECIMLTELWSSIVASTQQPTPHPHLAAVAAAQLGHLYLATNQLAAAGRQFEHMVTLGGQAADAFVEGAGLAFSGILQWQRANHAVAERHLMAAVQKLEQVRTRLIDELARDGATSVASPLSTDRAADLPDTPHANANADKDGTSRSGGGGEGGDQPSLLRAVPLGCALVLINACHRYRVCVMTNTYRYREAIEALERSLIDQYRDVLHGKLVQNFTATPTLEQIVAVAHRVESPLVYFALHKRYNWCEASSNFEVEDVLCTWLVPRNSDMRFIEMNVTKDFQTSVAALLVQARRGLHLDPLQTQGVAEEIFTTPHGCSWIPALQKLHGIFMDAVMDFIATLDLPVQHECRVVTIIPTGILWTVPFNVLMDKRKENRYLIEDAALQLAFSATHCAMSSLNAQRVRQRDLHRDVVIVQPEADPAAAQFVHVLYPFDPLRSVKEGAAVAMTLKDGTAASMTSTSDSAVALQNRCVVVSEREEVLSLLPRARLVHIASATTYGEDRHVDGLGYAMDGTPSVRNAGAVCVVSHGDVVLLHATDVAHMELAAELAVLSNTNLSPDLLRGTNDDTMGLVRAMSSGGVPCVLAGQWCTPDMAPVHLLTKFYTLLTYGRDAARAARVTAAGDTTTTTTPVAGEEGEVDATSLMRHKAIGLACAMRALMAEDTMRYSPRAWAGYYCIGHGYM